MQGVELQNCETLPVPYSLTPTSLLLLLCAHRAMSFHSTHSGEEHSCVCALVSSVPEPDGWRNVLVRSCVGF